MKTAVSCLIVIMAFAMFATDVFASGSSVRGGGDICEDQIKIIRDDIRSWISQNGHQGLSLPANLTADTYASRILEQMTKAKIKCVGPGNAGYPIQINQTPKTCRFERSQTESQIICDQLKFSAISESDRYVLIHHEFAGLADIEAPNADDSNYQLSNQISGYLSDQIVKKLVIHPQGTRAVWETVAVFPMDMWDPENSFIPTSDRRYLFRKMKSVMKDYADCDQQLEVLNLVTGKVNQISLKTQTPLQESEVLACSYDAQTQDLYYIAEGYVLWDASDRNNGAKPIPRAKATVRKVHLETLQDTLVQEIPVNQEFPILIESIGNHLVLGLKSQAPVYEDGRLQIQVYSKANGKKEFESPADFFSNHRFFQTGKKRLQYQSKLWFLNDKTKWSSTGPLCFSFVLDLSSQIGLEKLNVVCDNDTTYHGPSDLQMFGPFITDSKSENDPSTIRIYDLASFHSIDQKWFRDLGSWNQTLFGYSLWEEQEQISSLDLATGQVRSYPAPNIPPYARETNIERTFRDQYSIGWVKHEGFSGTPRACELFLFSLETGSLKQSAFYPTYGEYDCSLSNPEHLSFFPNLDEQQRRFLLMPASSQSLHVVDLIDMTSVVLPEQVLQGASVESYFAIRGPSQDWYLMLMTDQKTTVFLHLNRKTTRNR